jgi:hypothetical protein
MKIKLPVTHFIIKFKIKLDLNTKWYIHYEFTTSKEILVHGIFILMLNKIK